MSPDSRRVNFIWDKEAYQLLVEKAAVARCSVGELIRRAIEEKYADIPVENPVTNIRVTTPSAREPKPNSGLKALKKQKSK
jgi:hypothetical protein